MSYFDNVLLQAKALAVLSLPSNLHQLTLKYAVAVIATVLLLGLILNIVACRFLHLANIPGPPLAAYSRLWLMKTIASGRSPEIFTTVNQKYGKFSVLSC